MLFFISSDYLKRHNFGRLRYARKIHTLL